MHAPPIHFIDRVDPTIYTAVTVHTHANSRQRAITKHQRIHPLNRQGEFRRRNLWSTVLLIALHAAYTRSITESDRIIPVRVDREDPMHPPPRPLLTVCDQWSNFGRHSARRRPTDRQQILPSAYLYVRAHTAVNGLERTDRPSPLGAAGA
jgi:hypothetical protein